MFKNLHSEFTRTLIFILFFTMKICLNQISHESVTLLLKKKKPRLFHSALLSKNKSEASEPLFQPLNETDPVTTAAPS